MIPIEEDMLADDDVPETGLRTVISDAVRSSIVRYSKLGMPPLWIGRNFRLTVDDVLFVLKKAGRQPNPETSD
jgi:hypothetical protein